MNIKKINHQLSLYTHEVREICAPLLTRSKLNGFSYQRFYTAGQLLFLSTSDPGFNEYYIRNKLYPTHEEVALCPSPFSILSTAEEFNVTISHNPIWYENILLARQFQLEHRFFIINKSQDYYEVYCFTTDICASKITELFIGHYDVLVKFCRYFKMQAYTLIEKSSRSLIQLDKDHYLKKSIITHDNNLMDASAIIKDIENAGCIIEGEALSTQQVRCLEYLSRGYTSKEIAQLLNLSSRTVDNYINQLKEKFNCNFKRQLRELWQQYLEPI